MTNQRDNEPKTKSASNSRTAVLETATRAVNHERNNTYGPPTQDFRRTAQLLTALGFTQISDDGEIHDIQSHHIAMIMIALKLSRATWSPEHFDHWVDIAGYAGCGYECVAEGGE